MKQFAPRAGDQRNETRPPSEFRVVTNPEADFGPVNDDGLFRNERKGYLDAAFGQSVETIGFIPRMIDECAGFKCAPSSSTLDPITKGLGLISKPSDGI